MSKKTIYDALRAAGMTQEGACGLMGNMMAESGMRSNNAQDGCGVDDAAYTFSADAGQNNFCNDSIGYGLCQWTAADRKRKLLAYAKSQGVSVSDEDMQVRFCIAEMQQPEYMRVLFTLCSSHDIDACADIVCNTYERPAINNYPIRRQYAREVFSEFAGSGALAEEHAAVDHVGDAAGMAQTTQPEISGALAMLAGYLQTEEFQKNFLKYIEEGPK